MYCRDDACYGCKGPPRGRAGKPLYTSWSSPGARAAVDGIGQPLREAWAVRVQGYWGWHLRILAQPYRSARSFDYELLSVFTTYTARLGSCLGGYELVIVLCMGCCAAAVGSCPAGASGTSVCRSYESASLRTMLT
jgi:hypothetical protein